MTPPKKVSGHLYPAPAERLTARHGPFYHPYGRFAHDTPRVKMACCASPPSPPNHNPFENDLYFRNGSSDFNETSCI